MSQQLDFALCHVTYCNTVSLNYASLSRYSHDNIIYNKQDTNLAVLCLLTTAGMLYISVSQTFFKRGPLSLVRMFYGPPYSLDYQTH